MADTPLSLIDRIRFQADSQSWKRLVDLYTPLIERWLAQHSAPVSDRDDVIQEVLSVIIRELPRFEHNGRRGAFRCWLRGITVNRLRACWRARDNHPVATGDSDFNMMLDQLEDPDSCLSRIWDEEHDRHVARQLLKQIENDFEPQTFKAFCLLTLDGEKAAAVASATGMSVNAVLLAKSRVLRRLRQEMCGLVD